MAKKRSDDKYVSNYEFEVQLGLMVKISFQKISNIASEGEFEIFADGGNNDRMYFFEKPKRKPDHMIFTKGMATGAQSAILSCLVEGIKVNDIMILVKKNSRTEKVFYIEQGIISKVSFSDLDAQNGQVLIKSLEMQHTGVVEIPV